MPEEGLVLLTNQVLPDTSPSSFKPQAMNMYFRTRGSETEAFRIERCTLMLETPLLSTNLKGNYRLHSISICKFPLFLHINHRSLTSNHIITSLKPSRIRNYRRTTVSSGNKFAAFNMA